MSNKILDENAIAEIEARLMRITNAQLESGHHPVSWENAIALCATVRHLLERLADAKRWQMDVEEREAAVCPEDVGFDEYIRHLLEENKKLRSRVLELETETDTKAGYL